MKEASALPHAVQCLLARLSGRSAHDRVFEVDPERWLVLIDTNHVMARDPYSLVVGQVPFSGSVARDASGDLRTGRAELVAIARCLQALDTGGRALLLVPQSVLGDTTRAHRTLRTRLLDDNRLHAVIRLPVGWINARTSAALLVLERGGTTDRVWFCEAPAPESARPRREAAKKNARAEAATTDVPAEVLDVLRRWDARAEDADPKARATASFYVPRAEMESPNSSLFLARYRSDSAASVVDTPRPHAILAEIAGLEAEIFQGIRQLVGKLKE